MAADEEQMTHEQFRALAKMDSTALGSLASMALMVVAIKTERDVIDIIRELADVMEQKHEGPEEREALRRSVEEAMHDDDPEPPPVLEREAPDGVGPPAIKYGINLDPSVWSMDPDAVLDLIDRATTEARDQLLLMYEANREQVQADFPSIVR